MTDASRGRNPLLEVDKLRPGEEQTARQSIIDLHASLCKGKLNAQLIVGRQMLDSLRALVDEQILAHGSGIAVLQSRYDDLVRQYYEHVLPVCEDATQNVDEALERLNHAARQAPIEFRAEAEKVEQEFRVEQLSILRRAYGSKAAQSSENTVANLDDDQR
jgi:hypothetical protein